MSPVPKSVERPRTQIARAYATRSIVASTGALRSDLGARWAAAVVGAAQDFGSRLARAVATDGGLSEVLTLRPLTPAGGVDLSGLVALLAGPALLAAIDEAVAALPEGMSDADRTARLAGIDAELLRLGIAEERAIEASEAAGVPVARRGDADPRAVLYVEPDDDDAEHE